MPIPDFQSILLPLLKFAGDGQEHSVKEAREYLANELSLTEEERHELLPSGRQPVFTNRVAWAKAYLQMACLLNSPRRAHFVISLRGIDVLKEDPKEINIKFLERFPEFVESRQPTRKEKEPTDKRISSLEEEATPEELLENAYQRIRYDLGDQILQQVKNCPSVFFERLVIDLLVKMGYGGSRKEAGKAIGKSGDEGIDGIINEDRLGLDVIYIQAKKWEGTVGHPEIQKFVGALHGRHAKKGIFITTGCFSSDAIEYVSKIEPKVVLIDGSQLSHLMIDFDLGITTVSSYYIKIIDSDYFNED